MADKVLMTEDWEGYNVGDNPTGWQAFDGDVDVTTDADIASILSSKRYRRIVNVDYVVHTADDFSADAGYEFLSNTVNTDSTVRQGPLFFSSYPTTRGGYLLRDYNGAEFELRDIFTLCEFYDAGDDTFLGTTVPLGTGPVAQNEIWWTRFKVWDDGVSKTQIRAKAWLDGGAEPGTWDVEVYDQGTGSPRKTSGPLGAYLGRNGTAIDELEVWALDANGDRVQTGGAIEAALPLAMDHAVAASALAVFEGGAAFSVSGQAGFGSDGVFESEAALSSDAAIGVVSAKSAESQVALNADASLALTGETSGPGVVEAALQLTTDTGAALAADAVLFAQAGFNTGLGAQFVGSGILESVVLLAHGNGVQFIGGKVIVSALSLALVDGLSVDGETVAGGVISLGTVAGFSSEARMDAQAALELGAAFALQTIGAAVLDAGLSLDAVQVVSVSATKIVFGIEVPPGRTFTLEVDVRDFTIGPDDRAFTVQ